MTDLPCFADTFTSPPLSLPLEYALDLHLTENPDHIAITHTTGKNNGNRSYTYRELVPAIHRAGKHISAQLNGATSFVVAVLLKTETLTYITAISGLLRAGLIAFPISSRFSPSVVAYLLKEAQPALVLINDATKDLATQALRGYPEDSISLPILCELPTLDELYPGHNSYDPLPKHDRSQEDISVIMHSSSSSSIFPKIIPWSSGIVNHHGEVKDMPAHQIAGMVLGCYGLELFHSYGICIFFTMVRRGLTLAIMDPADKASILPVNMNDVYEYFRRTKPKILLTNPRAIEVAELRDSSVTICYGGRFLSKSVGDRLVKSGVKISPAYGATECGPLMLFPHFQGEDWEYWTVYPRPDLNFVPREDGLHELFVVPSGEINYLPFTNATWNGQRAYNPGDLFVPHPAKPYTYRVFGRATEQILLATGETINPIEIESELSTHSLITTAVMFGHTRFKVGIIIQPVESVESSESFLNQIWPTIESVNRKSPSYGRIIREMVIVADPKKPISINPKGLPRRPMTWFQYESEIDSLYMHDLAIAK